ncbi:DUF2490 domain-containing protein [Saccharicrinis sp. 156]|uniref:DUF2490 domain-containing protein n=1 Tax=Saccharicrinis sp. 156 TaxID=3417574 RepID=UPI003D349CBB
MIFKRTIVFICILLLANVLKAQKQELRVLVLEQFKIDPSWTTTFDGGFYKGYNGADWTRWGIRNLTAYKLSGNVSVDVGFMYNRTATPDKVVQSEFRPHQSIKFMYPRMAHMSFSHRFRMEEQFYTYNRDRENKNASRFRYEIKTKRAFNTNKNIEAKTPYWMASVEFFFNPVGKMEHDHILFNRGRHGIGIGYKLNSKTSLEGTLFYQHTHSNTNFSDYSDIAIFNVYIKNSLFSRK